ncbi:hypothetical protein BWQ93_03690 [Sphingopyxis sp. QXT-31]|jgi:hypothetical protein|uniref:hypothetical protein n=1 Tax=Sphingopyxis sp. QXT-31 TaxID=1357916 RepID=UPI0009795A19|nr:hypothetical protein [Sphingopyxis sp. QXT-31]APZ97688.1 hypothetical protein BWQ93_03690 [Sphingopyxis sp. QXT-31]
MIGWGWLIATTLVLLIAMNLHLWIRSRVIERRLDDEYDYFRYIERESAVMRFVNGVYTKDMPNHWLTDFLDKHVELAFEDPLLDDQIRRYRVTRASWFGGFGIWVVVATALAMTTA